MEGLAELHTHLGGSVSSEILWSLAHQQGIALAQRRLQMPDSEPGRDGQDGVLISVHKGGRVRVQPQDARRRRYGPYAERWSRPR